jgi:phenylalanine-4-hydroxylase
MAEEINYLLKESLTMKGHTYVSKPTDSKGVVEWSEVENETWNKLITRQSLIIKNRACEEFTQGLEILNFPQDRIPQIPELNEKLAAATGWGVHPVAALIQPKEFFTLLANKRFPATTFIRIPQELDYLKEPDVFHEFYGHLPLLTNETYANYMHKFGQLALRADPKDRGRLFRLFWFSIEFGLVKTKEGMRAYGGGILSSIGETQYALSDKNEKAPFDILNVLRTPFRIDIMQPLYYVLDNFEQLYTILEGDVLGLLEQSKQLGDFTPKFLSKDFEIKLNNLSSGWSILEGRELYKKFEFKSYLKTVLFANSVAWSSNQLGHHPRMIINYSSLEISITTHDAGNCLTDKDFQLAKAIDGLL